MGLAKAEGHDQVLRTSLAFSLLLVFLACRRGKCTDVIIMPGYTDYRTLVTDS